MNRTKQINELLDINDSYQAPTRLMEILYDRERRESLFKKFLELFDYDVTYDWFHEYFQEEHADRKVKKQDFTPRSVNELITQLVGADDYDGSHYEPCAGTGGMTITAWNRDRYKHSPFDYRPSWYVYTCEELSDRAIPFLLFNMLIRGMNAVIIHCDVLTRKSYGAFFVQNDTDNHLGFSSLNVMPYSDEVAQHLSVEWVEERYTPLVESPEVMPEHITNPVPRGEVSDFTKLFYALCGVEAD
ncbi:N-6 DNA methylase [Cytobacillus massiliigabonensis]|uniref:N-6 DNA methylase n=1 Tax=Cytobacillus massiliigabonensis TaxID=1871011 RepID=UPI000C8242AD|nr:N-6 DNA methylase [Cytobacillus massiliigabonensis]